MIVTSTDKIDTLTRVGYIRVLPNISPNPTNGKIKLAFGNKIPDDYSIRVFDATGRETGYWNIEKGENYLNIDLRPKIQGIYFLNPITIQKGRENMMDELARLIVQALERMSWASVEVKKKQLALALSGDFGPDLCDDMLHVAARVRWEKLDERED